MVGPTADAHHFPLQLGLHANTAQSCLQAPVRAQPHYPASAQQLSQSGGELFRPALRAEADTLPR